MENVNSNSDWAFLYWEEPVFSNTNTNKDADTSSTTKGDKT